jgi:peroxiredoxin
MSATTLDRTTPDGATDGATTLGPPRSALQAGTKAPDFSLKTTPDQTVGLSDFPGKRLIVAFYPADWSPVCSDQMALYEMLMPEFRKHGAEMVGVSVDGVWCHLAFARDRNIHFPLLADFEPKGDMARSYHVYRSDDGVSERALYVIDREGTISWSYVSPVGVNPGADGILRALEDMDAREGLA